jgi:hypothetical protein
MSLSGNKPQIISGALISASFVSDIYDVLDGTSAENISLTGNTSVTSLSATGSLLGTSSFSLLADNSISSSYAVTASYASTYGTIFTSSIAETASFLDATQLQLEPVDTLPLNPPNGVLSVSGSNLYFSTGSSWVNITQPVVTQLPQIKLLVTQNGTDDPEVTVFEEIGDTGLGNLTYGYFSEGVYFANEKLDLKSDEIHVTLANMHSSQSAIGFLNVFYESGFLYFRSMSYTMENGFSLANSMFYNTAITITVARKAEILDLSLVEIVIP